MAMYNSFLHICILEAINKMGCYVLADICVGNVLFGLI